MTNRTIVVGLAATFIAMTALLAVAGVIVSPVLLAVAIPFAIVSYFLWYHASGRLRDRVHREASRAGAAEQARARQRARAAEHRRRAYQSSGTTDGGFGRNARAAGDARNRAPAADRLSEREAYDILDLDPSADREAVRAAYRERAKRLHPDSDDGDEAAFKELNQAYERVKE